MARPRTFEEEQALDAAMHTFWVNGYEATSTQDLCEATGLGRSTIYNTFTSKHDLFIRALTRYAESKTATQRSALEDESLPPLERLRQLFGLILEDEAAYRRDGRGIGCLVVNSTLELAGRNRDATAVLEADLQRRVDSLRTVIALGQAEGSVTASRDAEALAHFVSSVIGGIRVSGRAGTDHAVLESIAATALDALTA
ncbi:TetR/AcrR family transcriptional regulator [Streptomonospora litoralis]|uniref:HTH-type transcriptional repressor ComR n=1 Tax=Streptomonospora litoralis TaxID=2498135 RepID=A0A4P6PYJ7_9ACTN|nr:TetR/AcrR family transcriptional regulator [Streptomonospora litoralis]QBI51951.1 HTH-type transcriptional repressor ComR [Streptomonospora litoralis]